MSEQATPNTRTVRARSCRKRSFISNDESSPEIGNSCQKKLKALTKSTPKTPARRKGANGVATKQIEDNVEKLPKRRGRPRKVQKAEDSKTVIELHDSPSIKQLEPAKKMEIEETGVSITEADDCVYEQKDTWPMKFCPSAHGIFVGNQMAVEKAERWLMEWKVATKKNFQTNQDSNSSSNVQESSSTALFITGPPGVGKTSLVYYLAKRLGFTVLEVNSSSERPGKKVLADLQEATQSQQVEGTKVSNGISAFFKPTLTQSSTPQIATPSTSTVKSQKKKTKVVIVKEKRGTLKNFFSPVVVPAPIEEAPAENVEEIEPEEEKAPKSSIKSFFAPQKKTATLQDCEVTRCTSASPEIVTQKCTTKRADDGQIKCSSSTIILFDDVDVIFDDDGDEGFWMALDTVLKSSKKPCILTATRGFEGVVKRCRSLQNAALIELHRPSPSHVASLVKDICLAENRDLTDYNVNFMCQYLASDVRRSLIQMEFETISSGLLQTVYPANKTVGGLMTAGSPEDALEIQIAFKKVGFNALYASLEDCLPFEFENVVLHLSNGSTVDTSPRRSTKFESVTMRDFSRIFDEFSTYDLFAGCLDRMGEECLPSYERAKRWMKQHPLENYDLNQRTVEELLELSSSVLLGKTSVIFHGISERFANLDVKQQSDIRFCRVANSLGFHDIHKQLKKVRGSESCFEEVLRHLPIRQKLAFDYLGYLSAICRFENDKRESGSRRGNRFTHYLSLIGLFLSTEQLQRISEFWS